MIMYKERYKTKNFNDKTSILKKDLTDNKPRLGYKIGVCEVLWAEHAKKQIWGLHFGTAWKRNIGSIGATKNLRILGGANEYTVHIWHYIKIIKY